MFKLYTGKGLVSIKLAEVQAGNDEIWPQISSQAIEFQPLLRAFVWPSTGIQFITIRWNTMPDLLPHFQLILTSNWLPYYTLAASALIYYTLIQEPISNRPHPRRKALKGLSHPHYAHSVGMRVLQKKAKEIYPEYFHCEGHYVRLPMGDVKYWLLGPENGPKVHIDTLLVCMLCV